jgi:hypothetical protein
LPHAANTLLIMMLSTPTKRAPPMPPYYSADRHGIRGNLSYADCWLSGYDAVGETHAARCEHLVEAGILCGGRI